jgi:GTP cyclohydrolase II
VFGSDICTCRPYLTFGIEEAVKEAQKGGSGVVIYFRKEGRALGEVSFPDTMLYREKNADSNRSQNTLSTMQENVAPTVQANTSSAQKTSPESRICVS